MRVRRCHWCSYREVNAVARAGNGDGSSITDGVTTKNNRRVAVHGDATEAECAGSEAIVEGGGVPEIPPIVIVPCQEPCASCNKGAAISNQGASEVGICPDRTSVPARSEQER